MSSLPSKTEILLWISNNPTKISKRDVAKAFGIKGSLKIDLKRVLEELALENSMPRRSKLFRNPNGLPPVGVYTVLKPDKDGDLFLDVLDWKKIENKPKIFLIEKLGDPVVSEGGQVLCEVKRVENRDYDYEAKLIRKISPNLNKLIGIFKGSSEGGIIQPVDKRSQLTWRVPAKLINGSVDGDLVKFEQTAAKGRLRDPVAKVLSVLGKYGDTRTVSLIAIHEHGIIEEFSKEVLAEAASIEQPNLESRKDLRLIPFVTIDPSDARDHDDACFVEIDKSKNNFGGYIVWVAIADVAHYVKIGSQLDREALRRGNSTYFPDRVVPMLPDLLSGDLCSLHEGVDRPCIAVKIVLNSTGSKVGHEFFRGLMKSRASLTYEEVQLAIDGSLNDRTKILLEEVIRPLYECYLLIQKITKEREPLDLNIPERKISLDEKGRVASVAFKEALDAHKIIEELMVLANVAAAEELYEKKHSFLYRTHEEPTKEKIDSLREVSKSCGLSFPKGQVFKTSHLNQLLRKAQHTDFSELINISTLRSMSQAYYGSEDMGHFGLSLKRYAHFTSPIRRYADLTIHRALIEVNHWTKEQAISQSSQELKAIGENISSSERKSMMAERDTVDRYLAAYLSEQVNVEIEGTISGVARFGVFVKLDGSGADGLVPVSTIGNEYFVYNRDTQTLSGEKSGLLLRIGKRVLVSLTEVVPLTGGLKLELLKLEGKDVPTFRKARRYISGKRYKKRK
ncbi:MAG: ribonuclease R [Paracoccaceae bacterium]|jgi:ribonuclease R